MSAYERYRGQEEDDHQPLYDHYEADERHHELQYVHYDPYSRREPSRLPIPPPAPYTPSHTTIAEPYTKPTATKPRKAASRFSATWYLFFLVVLSTLLFVFTIWFVQAAFSGETGLRTSQVMSKLLKADVGGALSVLRIAQGLLTTFTVLALTNAFELLQWALSGRPRGIGFASFLGLSPTTSLLGVVAIAMSRVSRLPERVWGFTRVLLVVAIWVAGVVLFIRASVITAYDVTQTYDVTAGVGQFNGSYVSSYLDMLKGINPEYNYTIVPSEHLLNSYSLVGSSMHSMSVHPTSCQTCDSYLLPGGIYMTTPWPPEGHEEYPLIDINDAPALRVDFERGMDAKDGFTDEDCSTYGSPPFLIGIKLCVSKSNAFPGSLVAGVYVCNNGTENGACSRPEPMANITTTMSAYALSASVVSSRSNFSIMTVTGISQATQNTNIDIKAYRQALDWILNFTASGIPPPSSVAEHFWNAQDQISSPYWSAELTRTLQSTLTFPLWLFNPNNYGNIDLNDQQMSTNLPKEFYTKASLTRPFTKIVLDRGMLIAFIALEGLSLLFIWAVLVWLWVVNPELPQLSSYPLVDFAFKAKEQGHEGGGFGYGNGLVGADDKRIRRKLKDVRVTLRGGDTGFM
ncbi:hypothetical protein BDV96DRAFT_639340 [Lophiotrema nucula]|uniref:Uncharacterized protein n=1 Tax=Lophiotrema nucula TaxID=690887 RepID=A0A6A5ZST9_9PLEO|nr:hypothetical protein BDV96DRAFT_639340 [Lophiotrema nucula]